MHIINHIKCILNKSNKNKQDITFHKGIGYKEPIWRKGLPYNDRVLEHNLQYKDYIRINIKHFFSYMFYENNHLEIKFFRDKTYYECSTDTLYKEFKYDVYIGSDSKYKYWRLSDIIDYYLKIVYKFINDNNLTAVNAGIVITL